jgi:hypothetical protein
MQFAFELRSSFRGSILSAASTVPQRSHSASTRAWPTAPAANCLPSVSAASLRLPRRVCVRYSVSKAYNYIRTLAYFTGLRENSPFQYNNILLGRALHIITGLYKLNVVDTYKYNCSKNSEWLTCHSMCMCYACHSKMLCVYSVVTPLLMPRTAFTNLHSVDLWQNRNRTFWGDDQGCLSERRVYLLVRNFRTPVRANP